MEGELIRHCSKYFRDLGFHVITEAEVVPGKSQYGKSDIIAYKQGMIYAIECKYINGTNSTKKRKKVKDQAFIYASILKWKYPNKIVKAYTYTNEGLQYLGVVSKSEGNARATSYFQHVGLRF